MLVVGGGLAGLSAALSVARLDPSRRVTILEREEPRQQGDTISQKTTTTAVGSWAAAGMLAPQSERLPPGPLLDLCLASRRLFPDFVDLVETLAQESGSEGHRYLWDNSYNKDDSLPPWSVGYVASGGFLAPALAGDSVATWAPPESGGSSLWLDAIQVRELEPQLHPDVVGGWWFPEDASVDARRLTGSLRAACVAAGVQLLCGPEYEIASLDLSDTSCRGVRLVSGRYLGARSVLVANGAWMRTLLPVPIEPHKGQSVALRMPSDRPPLLRRVLFAQDSYIVPKADGRIVIGATVEAGSFDSNVTPAGLLHVLSHALQLVPALKDLPIDETWAGLRPTTPDRGPILGKTLWDNLYVAGGYWRNGVLLAPKTGQLLAELMCGCDLSDDDQRLLDAFAWDRFTAPGQGTALAAQSRYAASLHPVHDRRSGAGIAAAVGTELGSYSSARSAAEERRRDRSLLLHGRDNDNSGRPGASSDDAMERAAQLGKQDSVAYVFGDREPATSKATGATVEPSRESPSPAKSHSEPHSEPTDWASLLATEPYEGSADALTVGSSSMSEGSVLEHDNRDEPPVPQASLEDAYAKIRANKARQSFELPQPEVESRPDPGFRIYHLDEHGQSHEVPPYTSPGDFLATLRRQQNKTPGVSAMDESDLNGTPNGDRDVGPNCADVVVAAGEVRSSEEEAGKIPSAAAAPYSAQTYDGYQDIQQANARSSRQDELLAMRDARRKNRLGQASIDPSNIGAQRVD